MTEAPSVQHRKAGIFGAFNRVASRYDLLSGLNPGYHTHLRWSAERLEVQNEGGGARILDLCCGTGLSTEPLVRLYPGAKITGLDKSEGMLEQARKKESLRSVEFLAGDGMDPAAGGAKGPIEAILMAYGIRNMTDPDPCLANHVDYLPLSSFGPLKRSLQGLHFRSATNQVRDASHHAGLEPGTHTRSLGYDMVDTLELALPL